jgi:hypothetical protein
MIDRHLFSAGTILWVALWVVFIARLAWLDGRLRAHLTKYHPHRWRSKEDYGDPAIGARRREMLTVFYDMLLVLAAMILWFVISAAMVELGPK